MMAAESVNVTDITCMTAVELSCPNLTRHLNCLLEENRNTRKRAIDGIRKETIDKSPPLSSDTLHEVFHDILKPLLKLFADPVEKCRETAIAAAADFVKKVSRPEDFLQYLMPTIVQRLAQQDIVEPSEELRLQLIAMLSSLIDLTGKKMSPYMDDAIRILQRTIVDHYPEVKKDSCRCASTLAKSMPEVFHMQSETLIKPLLLTVAHQHSKVRVETINTIGDVIQYGNGKSVDDVVSHLAQRLFDPTPAVRAAVVQVVGIWLLDLPDRYSFHHKLMPLLLTGITDDMPEIRSQADALWHDVGMKYAAENENDLKDKLDFVKPDPEHYPPGIERPNLGCRTLTYHNFSKILSGLVGDITDWVTATRVKSAQLLYTLLINDEDNITQHIEKVLTGLYKACSDEEKVVVEYVIKCAELLGYFVPVEVWCKIVLQNVKVTQSPGSLMILAGIIRGSPKQQLQTHLHDIASVIIDPTVCRIADTALQTQLLSCVAALVSVSGPDCNVISVQLFTILLTVIALHRRDATKQQAEQLLSSLATACQFDDVHALFTAHTKDVLDSMQDSYRVWTQHSTERFIFDTLLIEAGPVIGGFLDDVMAILTANLHPDKDPELRLKFFTLLSRLVMNASGTIDSEHRFSEFAVNVVRDMVLPNCVWRAGRVAGAIRTTAVSCLWALLQSCLLSQQNLIQVVEPLMTELRGVLEDDNKSTRLVACRVLRQVFMTAGSELEQDRLHSLYPDLLKRLDDGSDDVRVAAAKMFAAYVDSFHVQGYEVDLYRAHLEAIYRGLLVHLDDPDQNIQQAVLETLQRAGHLNPDQLLKEIDIVRHKHRTTTYCDKLAAYLHSLPKPD